MRVLQTLGHRTGFPPTPFYYRRESRGVRIESIVGQPIRKSVDVSEWAALLTAIASQERSRVFGVSSRLESQPNEPSLHETIRDAITGADDRLCAYITATLLHEGTLMIHHGPLGLGHEARVVLQRSEPELADISYATLHPEI